MRVSGSRLLAIEVRGAYRFLRTLIKSTAPPEALYPAYNMGGTDMNLFAFALILAVDIVIQEELLTYALIIWASVFIFRFALRAYIASLKTEVKTGRNYY